MHNEAYIMKTAVRRGGRVLRQGYTKNASASKSTLIATLITSKHS